VFFAIVIPMFWKDHAPPHFHALYAENEALISIRTLEAVPGSRNDVAGPGARDQAGRHALTDHLPRVRLGLDPRGIVVVGTSATAASAISRSGPVRATVASSLASRTNSDPA
jgi:hypothetical protein